MLGGVEEPVLRRTTIFTVARLKAVGTFQGKFIFLLVAEVSDSAEIVVDWHLISCALLVTVIQEESPIE